MQVWKYWKDWKLGLQQACLSVQYWTVGLGLLKSSFPLSEHAVTCVCCLSSTVIAGHYFKNHVWMCTRSHSLTISWLFLHVKKMPLCTACETKAELRGHKILTFSVSVPLVLLWNGIFDYWQEEFSCMYVYKLAKPLQFSCSYIYAKTSFFATHLLKAEREHAAELTPWAKSPGSCVH